MLNGLERFLELDLPILVLIHVTGYYQHNKKLMLGLKYLKHALEIIIHTAYYRELKDTALNSGICFEEDIVKGTLMMYNTSKTSFTK